MTLSLKDLYDLGQYTVDTIEDPRNEIDIRPEILNDLKKEVTRTKRMISDIPQDNPELKNIVSFFKKHRAIVDEVAQKPLISMDIEFTARFITSNQRRINEILGR
jgi:hypothetical protein